MLNVLKIKDLNNIVMSYYYDVPDDTEPKARRLIEYMTWTFNDVNKDLANNVTLMIDDIKENTYEYARGCMHFDGDAVRATHYMYNFNYLDNILEDDYLDKNNQTRTCWHNEWDYDLD